MTTKPLLTITQNNITRKYKQTKKAMFPKFISSALLLLPISYFRISAKLVLRGLLKNYLGRSSKFIFLGPTPEILSHWVWGVSQAVFLNHTLILVPSFICLFIQQRCEFILCVKSHNFIPNSSSTSDSTAFHSANILKALFTRFNTSCKGFLFPIK